MNLKERIKVLTEAYGPSGFEDEVIRLAVEMLTPLVDEIYHDNMGSVIACRKCGHADAKKLLIETHIDEIGFVITGVQDGFLKFDSMSRLDARLLPAAEIKILANEEVYGIIDTLPPHVLSSDDMKKVIEINDLVIDTGGKEVPVGTPAVFSARFKELTDGVLSGKAMDNRSCFAVALDVMERIKDDQLDIDVYLVASVQEEVGLRGAKTGSYSVQPDQAIVMDVTFAYTPGCQKEKTLKFGGGAAIGRGPHTSRAMTDYLVDMAKTNGTEFQIEIMPGSSGTTAGVVQLTGVGVPTAIVSLPIKYMHSPVETMHINDARAMSDLITCYIRNPWKGAF